ncbi:MAG: hypothetical protein QE271_08200 [Bacteriovoracaceae bacterium]|nr:hypothetical protein [Bacteriovoracaceae bacterium]
MNRLRNLSKNFHLIFFLVLMVESLFVGALFAVEPSFQGKLLWLKVGALLFVFVQWPIFYLLMRYHKTPEKNSLAWRVRWQLVISTVLAFFLMSLGQYWMAKSSWELNISTESQNRINAYTAKSIHRFEKIKLTFFADDNSRQSFLPWLLFLQRKFSSHVSFELVDANQSPTLVERFQIQKIPALSVTTERGVQTTYELSEKGLSAALTKILRPKRPLVCFTTGHGEFSIRDSSPQGIIHLKELYQSEGFAIQELDLGKSVIENIDCDFIIVLGPQSDLLINEGSAFQKLYAGQNLKGLFLAFDADPQNKLKKWESLLKNSPFELELINGILLDQTSPQLGLEASIVTGKILPNKINGTLNVELLSEQSGRMVFPLSRGISWKENSGWQSLMVSQPFPQTWLEKDLKTLLTTGKASYQAAIDAKGIFPLMATKEVDKKRIVVSASPRMLLNGYKGQISNFQAMLNLTSWGMYLDQEVAFEHPQLEDTSLTFVASQLQLLFYLSVLVVPFLMLGLAFWFWRSQRIRRPT